jgi:hypothetical protein
VNYHGKARVNPRNLEAFAVCDRCFGVYNHPDLQWQFEWRGNSLQNTRLLVCRNCLDIPQEQFRTLVLPPDPTPISDPRPYPYTYAETGYRVTADSNPRVTDDDDYRIVDNDDAPPVPVQGE